MNPVFDYECTANGSSMAVIEEMIQRCAPRLMKIGGRGFSEGALPLTEAQREAIRARWRLFATEGGDSRELLERIAEVFGVTYNTVCRVTRDLRKNARTERTRERESVPAAGPNAER
jgi:hypothetical protein